MLKSKNAAGIDRMLAAFFAGRTEKKRSNPVILCTFFYPPTTSRTFHPISTFGRTSSSNCPSGRAASSSCFDSSGITAQDSSTKQSFG